MQKQHEFTLNFNAIDLTGSGSGSEPLLPKLNGSKLPTTEVINQTVQSSNIICQFPSESRVALIPQALRGCYESMINKIR
jgi:hypothetical protein